LKGIPPAAQFPVFPVEPGIFAILLEKHGLAVQIASRINGLEANSRSSLTGNSCWRNRELASANRELAAEAQKTIKAATSLRPSKSHKNQFNRLTSSYRAIWPFVRRMGWARLRSGPTREGVVAQAPNSSS
jgi:hypothetical protein